MRKFPEEIKTGKDWYDVEDGNPLEYDYTDTQLNSLENYLKSLKLGVKLKGDQPKALSDIIYRVFHERQNTYYDNGKTQCPSSRLRSIEDLYRVCLTYIPNIKMKTLMEALKVLNSNGLGKTAFYENYCCTVNKWVHGPKNAMVTSKEVATKLGKLDLPVTAAVVGKPLSKSFTRSKTAKFI
jgi:hypothetical protein